MRRVVITGLGAVTPAGLNVAETWSAIVAGRSAIRPLEHKMRERFSVPVAAQVLNFNPANHWDRKEAGRLDRISQFAVVAARAAMADCGLELTPAVSARAMCIIGVAVGGVTTWDDNARIIHAENRNRVPPLSVPKFMFNAPASQISTDLGLRGMCFVVASACASGTHAAGLAFHAIRAGAADVAVAGGAESCMTAITILSWEALRVLSHDTCRPFSKNRDGLVLGEGSAMLVIEALEHAKARGARIYAEITGFGSNADAAALTTPAPDSVAQAMRLAMDDAGLRPGDVDYINAHGTGTALLDAAEGSAIRKTFAYGALPLVSSIKGVVGHSLGAAGAIEALATALTLHHQIIPPTANCNEPDPEIGLDVVAEGPRKVELTHALTNSIAFGGLNAVLAMRRYEP
jgi:nodulation protein E